MVRGRLLILLFLFAAPVCCQDLEEDGVDEADDGIEQDALTAEQMRALHGKFDADKTGKVSMSEVTKYASTMRYEMAKKDILTVLDEMDTNRDQLLDLEELIRSIDAEADGADDEEMKEIEARRELEAQKFQLADVNGDGHLDANELPALYYPETNDAVLEHVTQATIMRKDLDNDGKLTLKEFWEGDTIGGDESGVSDEEKQDFAKLDKNGDGALDVEELKSWESGSFHTEEAMQKLFEAADTDGDMHVTAEELEAARELIAGTDAQYHLMEWADHTDL